MGAGDEAGLDRVAAALDWVDERLGGAPVTLLVENTAGQGSSLGHSFEHLAGLLDRVRRPARLGFCVDTCHLLAAGYDFRDAEGYRAVFAEFDRRVGVERIRAFHLNDSKKDVGSRVDRHEHIGRGFVGNPAFARILHDPRFRRVPKVLETPKTDDMDRKNLALLRRLAALPPPSDRGAARRAGAPLVAERDDDPLALRPRRHAPGSTVRGTSPRTRHSHASHRRRPLEFMVPGAGGGRARRGAAAVDRRGAAARPRRGVGASRPRRDHARSPSLALHRTPRPARKLPGSSVSVVGAARPRPMGAGDSPLGADSGVDARSAARGIGTRAGRIRDRGAARGARRADAGHRGRRSLAAPARCGSPRSDRHVSTPRRSRRGRDRRPRPRPAGHWWMPRARALSPWGRSCPTTWPS